MWALRDDVGQTARNGPIVAFDVSLPTPEMQPYLEEVKAALTGRWPGAQMVVFGHLGDATARPRHAIERLVYGPLPAHGGSISAEHGIGLQKREFLTSSRTPGEIALMRTLRAALDPTNILNPGKVLA